jgi:hypothetical protein
MILIRGLHPGARPLPNPRANPHDSGAHEKNAANDTLLTIHPRKRDSRTQPFG